MEKEEEDSSEGEEEISDEEFEQFIQQHRFSENNDWGEQQRVAPVLESSGIFQENLEDSLGNVESSEKKPEDSWNTEYTPVRAYQDIYSLTRNNSDSSGIREYPELESTRRFDVGRSLIDNIPDSRFDFNRVNEPQQIIPMGNQQDRNDRRYLEAKQEDLLENRSIPFDRSERKKKGF
jgi:hypothetical protein